ncbi:MAG: hypothetical protein GY835_01165 [bacterium]|nr:hypothetical protein [bacterium]
MIGFIKTCGLFGWPLVLLALLNLILIFRLILRLPGVRSSAAPVQPHQINTILYWGCFAVVCGVLGQCLGIYNAMLAIASAESISPVVTLVGFGQSFTSTLFGLEILFFSTLAWLALRRVHRRHRSGSTPESGVVV